MKWHVPQSADSQITQILSFKLKAIDSKQRVKESPPSSIRADFQRLTASSVSTWNCLSFWRISSAFCNRLLPDCDPWDRLCTAISDEICKIVFGQKKTANFVHVVVVVHANVHSIIACPLSCCRLLYVRIGILVLPQLIAAYPPCWHNTGNAAHIH